MKPLALAATLLGLAALPGCATPVGPVEVTRFHAPGVNAFERGAISVQPAPGEDAASLEYRTYAAAVARELARLGYRELPAGSAAVGQVAELRIDREYFRPGPRGNPVSVGVGGSTGSYGSGVGLGIGLDLSGPPPEEVTTQLGVMIRDRATRQSLWEGRARFTVRGSSPLANAPLGAPKMAAALFQGFPGRSGETIEVE